MQLEVSGIAWRRPAGVGKEEGGGREWLRDAEAMLFPLNTRQVRVAMSNMGTG